MKGILNILKPPNTTSHDIVSFLRKKLNIKKIGHTGTLDPMAIGVLPICVGKATKVIEYMQNDNKKYRAELTLGKTTDTQDKWGKVLENKPVNVNETQIYDAISSFKGVINQVPPMYSALKHNGKKLYELAREGKTIDRKPREITIYNIDIIDIDPNAYKVLFDVECSKGTYVRTLCHDIGNKLGCGGHMSFLARLESGMFKIEDSVTVEEIMSSTIEEIESKYFYSLDYPLNFIPKIHVPKSDMKYVINGAYFESKDNEANMYLKNNSVVRIYIEDNFIALGLCKIKNGSVIVKTRKLFI